MLTGDFCINLGIYYYPLCFWQVKNASNLNRISIDVLYAFHSHT